MASILDKYGIKEVADVTFYKLEGGQPTKPVLYLDTLKVSTIEQTAETTEARGGKGNAALISWDYNKEITVTLEDALFSAKSMAIMFGDGNIKTIAGNSKYIMRTEELYADKDGVYSAQAAWNSVYRVGDRVANKTNMKVYDEAGVALATTQADMATATLSAGKRYFVTYDLSVKADSVIEISANSFPGTYYVTGDTYARSQADGKDEFFQFIIPKAKVSAENTITLEAEGDPSVFNMNLTVLRPDDGVMMKLVKYDLDVQEETKSVTSNIIHNHSLDPANA